MVNEDFLQPGDNDNNHSKDNNDNDNHNKHIKIGCKLVCLFVYGGGVCLFVLVLLPAHFKRLSGVPSSRFVYGMLLDRPLSPL